MCNVIDLFIVEHEHRLAIRNVAERAGGFDVKLALNNCRRLANFDQSEPAIR